MHPIADSWAEHFWAIADAEMKRTHKDRSSATNPTSNLLSPSHGLIVFFNLERVCLDRAAGKHQNLDIAQKPSI